MIFGKLCPGSYQAQIRKLKSQQKKVAGQKRPNIVKLSRFGAAAWYDASGLFVLRFDAV
jgi:hypothetical protein